jgi:hypothetical protein
MQYHTVFLRTKHVPFPGLHTVVTLMGCPGCHKSPVVDLGQVQACRINSDACAQHTAIRSACCWSGQTLTNQLPQRQQRQQHIAARGQQHHMLPQPLLRPSQSQSTLCTMHGAGLQAPAESWQGLRTHCPVLVAVHYSGGAASKCIMSRTKSTGVMAALKARLRGGLVGAQG